MSKKKSSGEGTIILAFLIGIPVFLMMEYPFIFWLVFVPVVTVTIFKFLDWLFAWKNKRNRKKVSRQETKRTK